LFFDNSVVTIDGILRKRVKEMLGEDPSKGSSLVIFFVLHGS